MLIIDNYKLIIYNYNSHICRMALRIHPWIFRKAKFGSNSKPTHLATTSTMTSSMTSSMSTLLRTSTTSTHLRTSSMSTYNRSTSTYNGTTSFPLSTTLLRTSTTSIMLQSRRTILTPPNIGEPTKTNRVRQIELRGRGPGG